MPVNERRYSVFVASPSDVQAEREQLADVVREMDVVFRTRSIGLRLFRWETDVYPAVGADPQAVIDSQIPDDYDIFVGILWARFGSETPRSKSGTLEEFERALARYRQDKSVRILIYFKEENISPTTDVTQLQAVQAFRASLSAQGVLYQTFGSADDFATTIRPHLFQVVDELERAASNSSGVTASLISRDTPEPDADLVAAEGELKTLISIAERSSGEAVKATQDLFDVTTRETEAVGADMVQFMSARLLGGPELPELTSRLAFTLNKAAVELGPSVANWLDARSESLERTSDLISALIQHPAYRNQGLRMLRNELVIASGTRDLADAAVRLRDMVSRVPRVAGGLTAAKRRFNKVTRDFEAGATSLSRTGLALASLLPDGDLSE